MWITLFSSKHCYAILWSSKHNLQNLLILNLLKIFMNKSDTMFENKNISDHKISCSNIYFAFNSQQSRNWKRNKRFDLTLR